MIGNVNRNATADISHENIAFWDDTGVQRQRIADRTVGYSPNVLARFRKWRPQDQL